MRHRHTGSEPYMLFSVQACAPETAIAACKGDTEHIAWAAHASWPTGMRT